MRIKRLLSRWRPTRLHVFLFIALLLGVAGEVFIAFQFQDARTAERADMADGCPDECLGSWLDMMFWNAMLFVWPVVVFVCAVICYVFVRAGAGVWHHMRHRVQQRK